MSCRKTLKFFRILVRDLISKITSFNLEILKKLVKKTFFIGGCAGSGRSATRFKGNIFQAGS